MTDKVPESFSELPEETRKFLSELSKEDAVTLKKGMPIVRAIMGFGKVTTYLIVTVAGLLVGFVMLWESILKILSWFSKGAGNG